MQNINPSQNITRRGRYYLFLGGLAFFGGAIAVALGVLFIFFPLWDSFFFDLFQILLIVGGVVALVVGLVFVYRALTLQKDNPLAYAVGEGMSQFLDERFTYLRNVSKRHVGYIDAVLVGPPGVLVFRIVDYAGTWINERAEWINQARDGKLRSARTNPTREVVRDVVALRKFLAQHGLENVPVYAIVVFTSPNVRLSADGPVVPICEIPTLYQIMRRDYLTDDRITPQMAQQTVSAIIDG
ncbi:MAG: NERD domain-containing protein [Anaerolineae bacterium]|nr:NERD domain-containing protein [Anaerolineae bacterium]